MHFIGSRFRLEFRGVCFCLLHDCRPVLHSTAS